MVMMRVAFHVLCAVFFIALPAVVFAATLSFNPSSGSYTVGEQFRVKVLVSSTGERMNAAGADISFSPEDVELVSISEFNSLIDVWGEKPTFSNNTGRASFEGLILDGYQGAVGELVTLIFRAKNPGTTAVRFSSGSVLAYDGLGTSILEGLEQANFTIISTAIPVFEIPDKIPEGFQFNKNLRSSDKNIDVAYLQLCLAAEGIYSEDITGFFGPKTKRAVIEFQEHYRDDILAPWEFKRGTGLALETTREKLNTVCFVAPVVEEPERPEIEEPVPVEIVIEEKVPFYTNIWFWIWLAVSLIIVILLLLIVILLLLRRTPEYRRRQKRRILKKKEKKEKELQKIEDKLKQFSK